MLVRHPQAAGGRARPHPTGLASHASLPQPPRRRPQRSLPRPPRPPPGAAPRPTCWGSYLDQARIAQRTSFLAVASCGLLPRTTRPGPRLRTAFWSVTSPHPRDMNGRPGPSAVRGFVVDFERFEPSHGVECHRAVSSWAKRACERSRRIRTSSPRALGSRILRRLRMTLHSGIGFETFEIHYLGDWQDQSFTFGRLRSLTDENAPSTECERLLSPVSLAWP